MTLTGFIFVTNKAIKKRISVLESSLLPENGTKQDRTGRLDIGWQNGTVPAKTGHLAALYIGHLFMWKTSTKKQFSNIWNHTSFTLSWAEDWGQQTN
jgi:hypothetical protein